MRENSILGSTKRAATASPFLGLLTYVLQSNGVDPELTGLIIAATTTLLGGAMRFIVEMNRD